MKRILSLLSALSVTAFLAGCASSGDSVNKMVISVPDQKMVVLHHNVPVATYPISTSKFGVGSATGSFKTPLGQLKVVRKVGDNAPIGAVFKHGRRTGEIVKVNAPGRDPIVTRVIMLRGEDSGNRNALDRGIFIHGTPEECKIGAPASYGCVRMKSTDVIELFDTVGVGSQVVIANKSLIALGLVQPEPEIPASPSADNANSTAGTTPSSSSNRATASAPKPTTTRTAVAVAAAAPVATPATPAPTHTTVSATPVRKTKPKTTAPTVRAALPVNASASATHPVAAPDQQVAAK